MRFSALPLAVISPLGFLTAATVSSQDLEGRVVEHRLKNGLILLVVGEGRKFAGHLSAFGTVRTIPLEEPPLEPAP